MFWDTLQKKSPFVLFQTIARDSREHRKKTQFSFLSRNTWVWVNFHQRKIKIHLSIHLPIHLILTKNSQEWWKKGRERTWAWIFLCTLAFCPYSGSGERRCRKKQQNIKKIWLYGKFYFNNFLLFNYFSLVRISLASPRNFSDKLKCIQARETRKTWRVGGYGDLLCNYKRQPDQH